MPFSLCRLIDLQVLVKQGDKYKNEIPGSGFVITK